MNTQKHPLIGLNHAKTVVLSGAILAGLFIAAPSSYAAESTGEISRTTVVSATSLSAGASTGEASRSSNSSNSSSEAARSQTNTATTTTQETNAALPTPTSLTTTGFSAILVSFIATLILIGGIIARKSAFRNRK